MKSDQERKDNWILYTQSRQRVKAAWGKAGSIRRWELNERSNADWREYDPDRVVSEREDWLAEHDSFDSDGDPLDEMGCALDMSEVVPDRPPTHIDPVDFRYSGEGDQPMVTWEKFCQASLDEQRVHELQSVARAREACANTISRLHSDFDHSPDSFEDFLEGFLRTGPITHDFSWSISKAESFTDCKRHYYYENYYSWSGGDWDATESRRQAFRLKSMTRIPNLAGDILRRVIANYFHEKSDGRELDEDALIGYANRMIRVSYKESRDGHIPGGTTSLRNTHLAEHHYNEACVDESSSAASEYGAKYVDYLQRGCRFFMNSPELAPLHTVAPDETRWVEGRQPGSWDSPDPARFQLFDTTIHTIPDLIHKTVKNGQSHFMVYSWKAGSPCKSDELHLGINSLYVTNLLGATAAQVTSIAVYLASGEIRSKIYAHEELETVLAQVDASLEEMRSVHFDAGSSVGDQEAFPMTNDHPPKCRTCNYRELCDRS